jgi:hypothetical protein
MTESHPSLADAESNVFLLLRYCTAKGDIRDFQNNCSISGPHVGVTRLNGQFEKEVAVRRKCPFWSRQNEEGGWDNKKRPEKKMAQIPIVSLFF